NYATNREDLVKLEGGQGSATENIIPPSFGSAYKKHDFYPYNLAKAKQLVQQAGAEGASVTVWSDNLDPHPKLAQYMASVLDSIGIKATVKIADSSVYWDLISTEAHDPQIAYNNWNQDFPEGADFFDILLNGENIRPVGFSNQSNVNIPAYNHLIDQAKQM